MSIPKDRSIGPPVTNAEAPVFSEFMQAVIAGNINAMRLLVAAGFDMASCDCFGTPILEVAIDDLEFYPDIPKYEVVNELLRLGANPCQLNADGFGPLFSAVLNMDTEMLRILLDAGADPNAEKMDSATEALYDWAEFDYRYEVWNLNDYGPATEQECADEDVWLNFLESRAIAMGNRAPDHLKLLRERGALSMSELTERPESPYFRSMDRYRDRFELRLESEVNSPQFVGTAIFVNGEGVELCQVVDIPALIQSLKEPGHYELFVCPCGKPRNCGATFHGVKVMHRFRGKLIGWDLRHPQYVYTDDAPYDGSEGPEGTSTFWFNRSQMMSAVQDYFGALQNLFDSLAGNLELPIHGQSAHEILKLQSEIGVLDADSE